MCMKQPNKTITASISSPILGTYEGELLDTNITNLNGIDITSEVIDAVLASDDYKDGIKYGWFIGYLGHPEEPDCADFQNGCIVMTEMHREDDGKVYGKFNLIDTPVGRIVKTFQDAGVIFGISIRGAGDIINQSVDPETFIFRGYDLVAFPAYPDSVPKFTAIAASTKLEDRKKYQAVCASVRDNLDNIHSRSTIAVLQSQFAPQSDVFKLLEGRKQSLTSTTDVNIDNEKIEAMTKLYLDTLERANILAAQVDKLKRDCDSTARTYHRKATSLERIISNQIRDTESGMDKIIADNTALRNKVSVLSSRLTKAKNENLIYRQRVESGVSEIQNKDKVIAGLQLKLRETVTANSKVDASASNLGETNKRLKSELAICTAALRSYQDAYAHMYAGALGVNIGSLSITASTTVDELQQLIAGATNTCNIPSTVTVEPVYLADEDDDNLITM